MSSINVSVTGKGDLERALAKAAKQFPATTEYVLKKEAANIAKDLKDRVNTEAKGHHTPKNDKPLSRSFKRGKVIKSGLKYTTAVTSNAPHYHLYEEGHDLVSHNVKDEKERVKKGSGKKIGEVKGRKTVAKYMAQRQEVSNLIGQAVLDEILREAGLE